MATTTTTTATSSSSSTPSKTSARCRCCPYGFHIDLGFVQFAEEVAKGNTMKRTPTLSRRQNGERNLMSPLDSLFSDSMENLVSDLEDVLNERPEKPKAKMEIIKDRMQNGYASDYTVYRSKPGAPQAPVTPVKTFALDFSPPKPPHRGGTPINSLPNGRSTPSGYATALGRTISEIKARNTESPIPDRPMGSRVGTPIDLGIPTIQNGRQTPPVRRNDLEYKNFQSYEVHVDRPSTLNSVTPSPVWRRPAPDSAPAYPNEADKSSISEFASLRRGREYQIPENDPAHQNRIRYYSASPKLPRKLMPTPNANPSHFTYAQQNGHTILAKSQGTCTSPIPAEVQHIAERPAIKKLPDFRTVSTTTGPLPPAKPCSECPVIKAELKDALSRVAPPKPLPMHVSTETDPPTPEPKIETVDKCIGSVVKVLSIGTDPDKVETRSTACSPIIFDLPSANTQTDSPVYVSIGVHVIQPTIELGIQTCHLDNMNHISTNTDAIEAVIESKKDLIEKETMTTRLYYRNIPSQTDEILPDPVIINKELTSSQSSPSFSSETASQTDCEQDSSEVRGIDESFWLMPSRETMEIGVGPDESYDDENGKLMHDCEECQKRDQLFSCNVGVGNCSVTDKVCVTCDSSSEEVNENDAPDADKDYDKPKQIGSEQVASLKKLLTSDSKQNFVRGTAATKSARIQRTKGDDLEYVEQKNKDVVSSASSTPTENTSEALKTKVILKKDVPAPPSVVPEPVPARIPRPKISKYAVPDESAETPDEADEATDRLTPLRSELRSLGGRWARNSPASMYTPPRIDEQESEEEDVEGVESDGSEGSYDTNEDMHAEGTPFEITGPLREALESLNSHLLQPGSVTTETADWALKYVQHEWLKTGARKCSRTEHVDVFLEQLKELGPTLLKTVVNISDQNGNTALHYAVSHGNFGIVSSLLDTQESQLNLANRAGYTAVMLAALSNLEDDVEKTVVQRLFEMGNVNARATQHGQTALMLAVSHGKKSATELLLICGADVNIQDEEGSTALMCAAEHGHKELVKLLLAQPCIDASLTDCDSSSALSIAVENCHRDIGLLIYAHINYTQTDAFCSDRTAPKKAATVSST